MRKLAERAQEAAIEIGDLSAATLEVASGAGEKMTQLVPAIRRTAELVGEISAACREQSIGIEQINQAIQQLDQVTQANAGAANEMTTTAEQLSGQAMTLNERAGFFKLDPEVIGKTAMNSASAGIPLPPARASMPYSRSEAIGGAQALQARATALVGAPRQSARSGVDLSLDGDSDFERMSA